MVWVCAQDDVDHEWDEGVGACVCCAVAGGVAEEAEDDFAAVEDADYFVARGAVGFDLEDLCCSSMLINGMRYERMNRTYLSAQDP